VDGPFHTFPQFWAICPTPMESINGDLRKGTACPSLDFRKLTIWETRLDMLPGTFEGANRVLHPSRQPFSNWSGSGRTSGVCLMKVSSISREGKGDITDIDRGGKIGGEKRHQ
jgi:hypothetical protein